MRHKVIAVYDRALGAFMRPFFTPAIGAAIRAFQDELNNNQGEMHKHPEDYELFHIGEWDDHNAMWIPEPEPQQIAIGKNLIKQ